MEEPPPRQPTWTRGTTWRQGHVFHADAAIALGLSHPTDAGATCVVVVSHDCDLANDDLGIEPNVEVIVGRITTPNGNYRWGKAPRTLHVDMLRLGQPVTVELAATGKEVVPKRALAAHIHDSDFVLEPRALNVLRAWLAVRYNRAAFPDAFVARLGNLKLDAKLAQLLAPYGETVSAIFFVVDDGREIDRSNGAPYELSIVLAFVPGDDPMKAEGLAERAATEVENLFGERCFDRTAESWAGVCLRNCIHVSEDDLTVSQAKRLTQWRLEYMTLRAEKTQPGPMPP